MIPHIRMPPDAPSINIVVDCTGEGTLTIGVFIWYNYFVLFIQYFGRFTFILELMKF